MFRTKNTLPSVYSESYDLQIFMALLDAIHAKSAIDIARARVAHNPRECFVEDLPHLASNFDLPPDSSRELLANYLKVSHYKGTQKALEALLYLVGVKDGFEITSLSVVFTDKEYAPVLRTYPSKSALQDATITNLAAGDLYVAAGKLYERNLTNTTWNDKGEIKYRFRKVVVKGDFSSVDWNMYTVLRKRWLPINVRIQIEHQI